MCLCQDSTVDADELVHQCQSIGSYSAVWQQITLPELLSLNNVVTSIPQYCAAYVDPSVTRSFLHWFALYVTMFTPCVYISLRALSVWWMLMAWCLRPMASAPPWLTYTYLRHQEYPACNEPQRFHKLKCNSTLLNQLISIHMVMWFLSIHPATWVLFLLQSASLLCLLFYFVSVHTWFYMTIMEKCWL